MSPPKFKTKRVLLILRTTEDLIHDFIQNFLYQYPDGRQQQRYIRTFESYTES